ncbi:hypothetical protein HK096_001782, partial [Nowakowskiella sp. JEL0078]
MTAEYVGHTKKKVEEKLDEARGGVLFIDEAYELGKGHFGVEAMTTLVAAMTNPTYKGMVIIIAGYLKDINRMLDLNSGLKSRFTRFFNFENWEISDCIQYVNDQAEKDDIRVEKSALECFSTGFEQLIRLPGFGNGRDVVALWKKVLANRADRVVTAHEIEKTVVLADVRPAVEEMVRVRTPPQNLPFVSDVIDEGLDLPFEFLQNDDAFQNQFNMNFKNEENQKENNQAKIEEIFDDEEANPEELEVEKDVMRDIGVSDEIWEELKKAKDDQREKLKKMKIEMEKKR